MGRPQKQGNGADSRDHAPLPQRKSTPQSKPVVRVQHQLGLEVQKGKSSSLKASSVERGGGRPESGTGSDKPSA